MEITQELGDRVRQIVREISRGSVDDDVVDRILFRLSRKESLEKPVEHFVRRTARFEVYKALNSAKTRRRRERSLGPHDQAREQLPDRELILREERNAVAEELEALAPQLVDSLGFFEVGDGSRTAAEFAAKWDVDLKQWYRDKDRSVQHIREGLRKKGFSIE